MSGTAPQIVEVSSVKTDADGSDGVATWEVSVRRLPGHYSVSATFVPEAGDVPDDIRRALSAWLATAEPPVSDTGERMHP